MKSKNSALRSVLKTLGIFAAGTLLIVLIVSFFVLNKRFAFNTTCVVLVYSGFMYLLGRVDCPQYDAEGEYGLMLIAALAGGVLSGMGCGFMFRSAESARSKAVGIDENVRRKSPYKCKNDEHNGILRRKYGIVFVDFEFSHIPS